MLNNIKDGIIVFLLTSLVFSLVSCAVLYHKWDNECSKVAEAEVQKAAAVEIANAALTDATATREEFKYYKNWVINNPPPKDAEGIRRWMIEAGKR